MCVMEKTKRLTLTASGPQNPIGALVYNDFAAGPATMRNYQY